MPSDIELLLRKVLVFVGDVNRMDIRLSDLRKEAELLSIDLEDLPESEKTLCRLRREVNDLYNKVDKKLDGE